MTGKTHSTDESVIGAIRLALEGAATDDVALRMVKTLVEEAPPTNGNDIASVSLLIKIFRQQEWSFTT